MNRRTKFALWVLPLLVLSVTLGWVKWKADNPTPTKLDLEVRKRFLYDKEASISFQSDERYDHQLSLQERKEISDHLWLICTSVSSFPDEDVVLNWASPPYDETVSISNETGQDVYRSDESDWKNDNIIQKRFRVHPATSLYMRQWLANHPGVRKQLHLP